jgi:hypothetical protein
LPVKQDVWWQQSRLIPHFEAMQGWSEETFHRLRGWGKSLSEKVNGPAPAP